MEVKEQIYQYIKEQSENQPEFVAGDVAEIFNIKRNVASHYLNRLVEDGKLEKEETRPVRFRLGEAETATASAEDVFREFVGYNDSCRNGIEKCKVSVTYPVNGMPLIICGNSGVGKSFLASLIQKYAVKKKVIREDAPFVVLNCADYANNPELLSSTLFGYTKGAFTGANEEKEGLLDEADGGYLFLDEVHNLSAENQEKLFIFIDSGKFRRLGNGKQWVHSTARLIFATTENIQSTLLTTFRRRIPLEIRLPDFIERSYNERLQIVLESFRQESRILHKDLKINSGVVKKLVNTEPGGNIGEIKNQIKVMCAQAYNDQDEETLIVRFEKENVDFKLNETYEYSISGTETGTDEREYLQNMFDEECSRFFENMSFHQMAQNMGAYLLLLGRKIKKVFQFEAAFYEADYFQCLYRACMKEIQPLLKWYGQSLTEMEVQDIFRILASVLFRREDEEREIGISSHERREYQRHFALAEKILDKVAADWTKENRKKAYVILAAYLYQKIRFKSRIPALVVMHGESSATSIAHLINEIMGDYVYEAFDMAIHVTNEELIAHINDYVSQTKTQEGMIVLVDMGSLEQMYEKINQNVEGDLLIINNVTTMLAMEVGALLMKGEGIEEITGLELDTVKASMQYYQGISQKTNIIVSCISGEGIAVEIQNILSHYVKEEIEIITMDYHALKEKLDENEAAIFRNTIAVFTTSSLESGIVPIMNIEDVISGFSNLQVLDEVMKTDSQKEFMAEMIKLFSLKGVASRLNFLNPEKLINEVEHVIYKYETCYSVSFPNFLRTNLFLHISIMIERTMMKDSIVSAEGLAMMREQEKVQRFVDISKDIFKQILGKYKIEISDSEYVMIYQIVEQYI